jgi:hypothetical protein
VIERRICFADGSRKPIVKVQEAQRKGFSSVVISLSLFLRETVFM